MLSADANITQCRTLGNFEDIVKKFQAENFQATMTNMRRENDIRHWVTMQ